MKDKPNIKTLCHLQQDCGACMAFREAFKQHSGECRHHDAKFPDQCELANNPVPHCCAVYCPTFDRDSIFNEEKEP